MYFNLLHRIMRTQERKPASISLGCGYTVEVIPILSDNFSFALVHEASNTAVVVDPAEPGRVTEYLTTKELELKGVLTTHHHWDHAGGNEELRSKSPDLPVYALDERVSAYTRLVSDGDEFELKFGSAAELRIRALHTPCHTRGHACFYVIPCADMRGAVFTGDTLFVGGCGKFFEGAGDEMQSSLDKLAELDAETLVFCGHEYTLSNFRFAVSVDGTNEDLLKKRKWAKDMVANGNPTVPSTIGEEKSYNPFMRTSDAGLAEAVGCAGKPPGVVMAAVRRAKDRF